MTHSNRDRLSSVLEKYLLKEMERAESSAGSVRVMTVLCQHLNVALDVASQVMVY